MVCNIIFRLMFVGCVFIGVGCESENKPKVIEKRKVICTTTIVADLVKNILPEDLEVYALMRVGVDPHAYQASAKDNELLVSATAFGYSGLNLEAKLSPVLKELANSRQVVALSDALLETDLIAVEGAHGAFDPHIWMDVRLMIKGVRLMSQILQQTYPDQKQAIHDLTISYVTELEDLDAYVDSLMQLIPKNKRILITAHHAFAYFGKRYNVVVKSMQGVSTVSESGLKHKEFIMDYIKLNNLPGVFIEHGVNPKNVEVLIESLAQNGYNLKLLGNLYSDSLGELGSPQGSYIGMIKHNAETIYHGLKH